MNINLDKEYIYNNFKNDKIKAIKYVRKQTLCDLIEANEYVEKVFSELSTDIKNVYPKEIEPHTINDIFNNNNTVNNYNVEATVKLTKIECETCGAKFDFDLNDKKVTCPYCNTSYIYQGITNTINDNINILRKKAKILLESHDFYGSANCCNQILNIIPDDGESYLMLLQAELKHSEFEGLLSHIRRSDHTLYRNNSNCYNALKFLDRERAVKLEKALLENENSINKYNNSTKKYNNNKNVGAYYNSDREFWHTLFKFIFFMSSPLIIYFIFYLLSKIGG